MMRRLTRLATVAAIAICCGCSKANGPQIVATTGVVRFQGQPLAGARVLFHPASGRPAQGTTDAQGRFQLSTLHPSDGAVVGMHHATVTEARSQAERMPGPGEQPVAEPAPTAGLSKRYADPQTSGLEFEVKAGAKNDFALDLE